MMCNRSGIQVPSCEEPSDWSHSGRKFRAHQTFDIIDEDACEEVAVMVDIKDPCWFEEWRRPGRGRRYRPQSERRTVDNRQAMTASLGVAPDHRTRARGDEPASPSEDMQTDAGLPAYGG